MRFSSITATALFVGAVAGIITAVAVILTNTLWWHALLTGLITFVLSSLVAHLVMRRFVIYKLKPIYQRLFSKEMAAGELKKMLSQADNMADGIEDEITNWAAVSQREITRLKENERYRKEYVGNVSHELKTPIFNIQGYINTLLDGGLEDDSINKLYLERTEKSIDRLINIILDLEQISKLEAGVLKLSYEQFDIVELVRESIESIEIEATKKQIRITIGGTMGFQTAPIWVNADKHYISQVLINLLSNSIKYGSERGRTRVTFVDLFDKVLVNVTDNGSGVEKGEIPRLFERFYRTDKSRSREQGGTGLGLSIVKHIIEAHRESITVRSELGKGTTFSFTLTKPEARIRP